MGTIDEQKVIPFGSIADLKSEIEERMEKVSYNVGIIIGPTHNIQNDTSLEKI